jgi:hypothetical protein
MTEPVTGDAEIRPGEKFAEDALAQTCEMQRESIRKMQTALDLQDSELRELRAARAGLMKQNEDMTKQLADRRTPWISAMAAEIANRFPELPDKTTILACVNVAKEIYSETERHFGGAK